MSQQQSSTTTRPRRLRRASAVAAIIVPSALIMTVAATHVRSARASVNPGSDVHVIADLDARKLTVRDGDSTVLTFPIGVGRSSMPTPRGHYSIDKIVWNPRWVPPDKKWAAGYDAAGPGSPANPMRTVKIFFHEPDYYIHGTNDVGSLGYAESHGCLRMDPGDAFEVARYLMEHSGAPRDESWYIRVLHFRDQSKTVYLGSAVPMTVM